jgi:hypothetical protein
MADQVQQVVSDIPQWMRDLMFGSKPAGMSDEEWNNVRAGGFQGLIPSAYSAAAGMAPSAEQRAALGAGIPEQRVAGLDSLALSAQDMAMRAAGVAPAGSTPEQAQAFAANRNLAMQVMRGQVNFADLTPAQQQAVSQADLGYAPYLQGAQDMFGVSAAGFGSGQRFLEQGIGSALQFGGDAAARQNLINQSAGLSPEQQAQLLRDFDDQTAYGRLGAAQRELTGVEAQRKTAYDTAQTDFNAYRDWLNTQTTGAPTSTEIRDAATGINQTITGAVNAGRTDIGNRVTGITSALTDATTDIGDLTGQLQTQGADLKSLPETIRTNLTTAASGQAGNLSTLGTSASSQAGSTQRAVDDALKAAGGNVDDAISQLKQQGLDLDKLPATTRNRLISAAESAHARLEELDKGALDQAGITQRQLNEAVQNARQIAGTAASSLLQSGAQFDPESTQAFVDPYRRDVVEAQQQEMQRLADIQRQSIRAQAVQSGAFGGSREGVQQAELTRNLVDQQSRLSAELMSQGYTQAQANAMAAFEQAQQRQLQGAAQAGHIGLSAEELASRTQATGGQMGIGALQDAMRSAQFMAQQGLSAEDIAARTGLTAAQIQQAGSMGISNLAQSMGSLTAQSQLAAGETGLAALRDQMQNAQFLSGQGLSAEEIAARSGLSAQQLQQAGLLGEIGAVQQLAGTKIQGQSAAGSMQQQMTAQELQALENMAQRNLSAEQIAAQTRLSEAQMGQAGRIAGLEGSVNLGNLGLQRASQGMQGADLLRTLGATQAQMAGQEFDIYRQAGLGSFAGAEALGGLGSRQLQQAELSNALQGSDINRLLSFGTLQQGQQQLGMDVNFQNQMRQWSAPMQQTQWLGDFVRGFPSGQSTTAMTSQSQPGWGQQLLGAGIAGLGLAAGRSNFGFGS